MAAAVMEVPAVQSRCSIEEVFTASFIELLTMAPRNPVVRSLVLALTRRMPPPECQNYEQVKDWIETNCKKRLHKAGPGSSEGIHISVNFSDKEYGRASYSVNRYGMDDFQLDADELLESVRDVLDSGQKLDALITQIVDKIEECAWERCDPALDDYGDYDYSDHDQDDTEHSKVEFSKPQVRERVVAFLQEYHPDLWEELT
jgi:hypothetical protein